jgi:hypothetical protein
MVKTTVFYIRVIITIISPFILLFLPANYFDQGDSICLSKMLLNYQCYACGLTKATMHFIHFEFEKAWSYNKLVFIVVPMLVPLWAKAIYEIQGKKMPGVLGRLT